MGGYTVGELYDRFHEGLHTQRAVAIKDVRNWIEEAQTEIAMLYGKVNTQVATGVVANQAVALGDDCLGIVEIRKKTGDYRPYQNYMVTTHGSVIFVDGGNYDIYYHKSPEPLSVSGGATEANYRALELEVHNMFHLPIINYLFYKYWDKNSEGEAGEKNYADAYLGKFHQEISGIATLLRGRANTTTKMATGPKPTVAGPGAQYS